MTACLCAICVDPVFLIGVCKANAPRPRDSRSCSDNEIFVGEAMIQSIGPYVVALSIRRHRLVMKSIRSSPKPPPVEELALLLSSWACNPPFFLAFARSLAALFDLTTTNSVWADSSVDWCERALEVGFEGRGTRSVVARLELSFNNSCRPVVFARKGGVESIETRERLWHLKHSVSCVFLIGCAWETVVESVFFCLRGAEVSTVILQVAPGMNSVPQATQDCRDC